MEAKIVSHPLCQHLLARLRDAHTPPAEFRSLASQLTTFLAFAATDDLATTECTVETPLERTPQRVLNQGIAAVPVLRAGLAMLEAILAMFPDVSVGYIGLERHEETAIARTYYRKLPPLENRLTLCLDPMLATGGSAVQAINYVKEHGASKIKMISVVSTPEGVQALSAAHPDVEIITAAIDRGLNERKFIVPGLGDFGDRLYGT